MTFWTVTHGPGAGSGGGAPGGAPGAQARAGRVRAASITVGVITVAAVIAVAASAAAWLRGYDIRGAPAFLWSAAAASALLSTATTRIARQRAIVSYGASLLSLVLVLLALCGPHPDQFWHGLTHGPALIVSETLPLGGSPSLLAAPVIWTWVCGVATTELLWRARVPIGLVVPLIAFVGAYAATSGAPGNDTAAGATLLAAVAVAAVAVQYEHDQERAAIDSGEAPARLGRASVAAAAAAVALAVLLAATVPSLPGLQATPARVTRMPQSLSQTLLNPVATMASLRNESVLGAAPPLATVGTSQASTGYFGVATLDGYDGGSWSFDTTFQPTGRRVPPAPASDPGSVTARGTGTLLYQRFELLHGYPLQLIPMAYRPLDVRGFEADADAATGMVVPAGPVSQPFSYEVTSQAPILRLETVPKADGIGVVAGEQPAGTTAEDVAIPAGSSADIAAAVRYVATVTGERPAPTVAFLQSALMALRNNGLQSVPKAGSPTPSVGTGLAEVINATTVTRAATPEQYATMFAMLARYLGVPARVVTGFRVTGPAGRTSLLSGGSYSVTGREAWTWVEIPVAGVGWVVADATPSATTAQAAMPPAVGASSSTTLPPRQANAVPENQITGHPLAPPGHIPPPQAASGGPGAWELAWLSLGGLAFLVVLYLLIAALRRWMRRRARRSANPDELAVGAWLELLDDLERAGLRSPDSATTGQIAADATTSFGEDVGPSVAGVGAIADRAVFASRSVDGESAGRAWQLQGDVHHHLRAHLDRRQLARAALRVGHQPRRPRRQ